MKKKHLKFYILLVLLLSNLVFPISVDAVDVGEATNTINRLLETGNGSDQTITTFLMMTLLSIVPILLVMTTSFTRIIMVLSFTRNSLGTQQSPPNQVLIGLALFLTFFIMRPVYSDIYKDAIEPFQKNEISQTEVFERSEVRIKEFMYKETREKDLKLFVDLDDGNDQEKTYASYKEIPLTVITPAFIISELRTAFSIGFFIFIPFLIIDMVVSSILMSMGMFMLSPVMISLPFKILLFVVSDGWHLIVEALVKGFQ